MTDTVVACKLSNGDIVFKIPAEGYQNINMVTLQEDGDIRWSAVGPMTPKQTSFFCDAIRLALSVTNIPEYRHLACGIAYDTISVR